MHILAYSLKAFLLAFAFSEIPTEAVALIPGVITGAILGATIVGAQAGELITYFTVAVQSNGAIGAVELAKAIAPYPTNTEAIKYCCNQYNIQVRACARQCYDITHAALPHFPSRIFQCALQINLAV